MNDPWKRLANAYDALDREATSWRFEPLDVENIEPPPEASLCRRDDGQGLMFSGMAHSFFGEADSMKSWIAAFLVREAMSDHDDDGRPPSVMYLDCERNRRTFVRRMASIGTDLESLRRRCAYFRVRDPLVDRRGNTTDGFLDLDIALEYFDPAILVIDGVTEFMAVHEWDVNNATDVARYHALLLRRWPGVRTTVEIDHTAKNTIGTRTQLGSQHKRAGIDGASYEVVKVKGMSAGLGGVSASKIKLRKDNEGGVREKCDASGTAAIIRLDSSHDPWKLELLGPESWATLGMVTKSEERDAALNALADQAVDLLRTEPLVTEALRRRLAVGRTRLKAITDRLEEEGRIRRDSNVRKNPSWVVIEESNA